MKIIISPSKTQKHLDIPELWRPYVQAASIQTDMKRQRAILQDPLAQYAAPLEPTSGTPALLFYTGLVYKQLNLAAYDRTALDYINQHLILLSAFYGFLNPFEPINAYRLDYKVKFPDFKLYDYWRKFLDDNLPKDTLYVNLASDEFSKSVTCAKLNIHFRENIQGRLQNKATFSKMARGRFLHEMIINQVVSADEIKKIAFDGYQFNADCSTEIDYYFIR